MIEANDSHLLLFVFLLSFRLSMRSLLGRWGQGG